ncbi:MAG TPA: 4Fe-4S dicluster domain-containing protein [Thermodesulfovibrionales bacterium]|nr:4Fe-4S dicluster domain-containing protein [Thermodesulfovibrionales bacterium]
MATTPRRSIVDERDTTRDSESDSKENTSGKITRRCFLGSMTALGATAVIGSHSKAYASKDFAGSSDRFGMLTDLTACVGCRSCEKACNEANNLPKPELPFDDKSAFDKKRRPDAKAYTVVNQYPNPKDKDKPLYRKLQCNHCNEPSCATACPIHAYTKTPEGPVVYNEDLCFGCRYCMTACPFYVPAYDYESALEPKIVKCSMCHDRVKRGGIPACADACPAGAITFGKRIDLLKLARERIAKEPENYIDHIYGEHEAGGTSWLYISGVPFGELGFPTNIPTKPLLEETKGFLSAVPLVFTVWPALFGMCYAALRHRDEIDKEKTENGKKEEVKHG